MTSLSGRSIGSNSFLFEGRTLDDAAAPIQITAILTVGGLLLEARSCTPAATVSTTPSVPCLQEASGSTVEYLDDFTSDRQPGRLFSSPFWPEGAHPPSEPCVQYNGLGHDRYLTFIGYQDRPAYLAYRLPVDGSVPPGPLQALCP